MALAIVLAGAAATVLAVLVVQLARAGAFSKPVVQEVTLGPFLVLYQECMVCAGASDRMPERLPRCGKCMLCMLRARHCRPQPNVIVASA
jgi:hypothetical protein